MSTTVTALLVIATLAYTCGAIASFTVGASMRENASITLRVWGKEGSRNLPSAEERLRDAREGHRNGCRRQVRSPIWPLDAAHWLKNQIVSAIVGAEPDTGPETVAINGREVIVQKEDS